MMTGTDRGKNCRVDGIEESHDRGKGSCEAGEERLQEAGPGKYVPVAGRHWCIGRVVLLWGSGSSGKSVPSGYGHGRDFPPFGRDFARFSPPRFPSVFQRDFLRFPPSGVLGGQVSEIAHDAALGDSCSPEAKDKATAAAAAVRSGRLEAARTWWKWQKAAQTQETARRQLKQVRRSDPTVRVSFSYAQ